MEQHKICPNLSFVFCGVASAGWTKLIMADFASPSHFLILSLRSCELSEKMRTLTLTLLTPFIVCLFSKYFKERERDAMQPKMKREDRCL